MTLEQQVSTRSSDNGSTDSLRHSLSVRFAVSEGSSAGTPHGNPPSPSPPPPSFKDTNKAPTMNRKEAPESPILNESSSSSVSSLSPTHKRALHSLHLRSNLTREQRDRDPLFFYEIVKTLGAGSMGSVAQVRKRVHVVGGSAREDIQEAVRRHQQKKNCLEIPIIGGIFRMCIDGDLKLPNPTNRSHIQAVFSGDSIASLFRRKKDLFTSSNGCPPSTASLSMSASASSLRSVDSRTASSGQPIQYAMKSIHLNRVADAYFLDELRNEVAILKQLDHPHIVRAIETFENRNQIFIVMELCSGGDLYSRDPYTEEEAARIVSSILSAIAYMHSRNILHRDLKFENVLFVNDNPKAEIKLIDFGLSKVYGDNTSLTEGVGTIYTMAPEVLRGDYTEKADIWSVGVVAYMLLSSQMPFCGRKRHQIVEQIFNAQFDFRGRRWKRISSQAKAFVEELLVLDAEERLDAKTALRSTWLNRAFGATARGPDMEEESMAKHAMLRYAGYTKLKKMALMVVAHKSSSAEIGILRKLFQKYDKQRDGSIGFDDFCDALSDFGESEEDLKAMFEAVDLDGTGRIRYTEFLAATIEAQGAISEQRLAEAFDRLDCDDSGKISAENLAELLGHDFPREEIDEIIAEVDVNNDHQISYAAFLALWEDKHELARIQNLNLLKSEVLPGVASDSEMNSFKGSCLSICSSYSQDQVFDSSEARAAFIRAKHSDAAKHVGFTGSVVEIHEASSIEQTLMIQ